MPLDTTSLRGIDDKDALSANDLLRRYHDKQKERPSYRTRSTYQIICFMAAGGSIFFRPGGIPFLDVTVIDAGFVTPLVLAFFCFLAVPVLFLTRQPTVKLPFNLPIQSGRLDPNDPEPGKTSPGKAKGSYFLGVNRKDGAWVFLSADRIKQHMIFFGTTGAGKTSVITGIIANSLMQSSGLFMIDAKADLKFYHQLLALSRILDRDIDLRVMNLLNIDPAVSESHNTNTFNMFAGAPADDLANMIISMKSESAGGNNKEFSERGNSIVNSLVRALVYLRDNCNVPLSLLDVRDYLTDHDNMVRLSLGCAKNGKEIDAPADFQNYATELRSFIVNYFALPEMLLYAQESLSIRIQSLKNLPTDIKATKLPDPQKTDLVAAKNESVRQFGFATFSFGSVFTTFLTVYRHIFAGYAGDLSIDDAVKNRRITIVLLPSLAKAKAEVMSAARIFIANMKGMAARSLGVRTFGNTDDLLNSLPTQANSPMALCFEEASTYVDEGMDELYKQMRGLNLFGMTCIQDIPGWEKNNAATAKSIVGSANYAFFMRTQDAEHTGKLAQAMAETAYTGLLTAFESKTGVLSGNPKSTDSSNLQLNSVQRVTFTDLQMQREGQMTVIAEGKVVRMQAFFVDPLKCVRADLMQSSVRRLGGWRWPMIDRIRTVPRSSQQGTPVMVEGDLTYGTATVRSGSAKPRPSPSVAAAAGGQGGSPTRQPGSPSALNVELPPGANDEAPMFETTAEAQERRTSSPRPVPTAGVTPLAPPARPTGSSLDQFGKLMMMLDASRAGRIEQEEVQAIYLAEASGRAGYLWPWEELLGMSRLGLEIALDETNAIDPAALFIGLVALTGIRAQCRREDKMPPFVPKAWTSRRVVGQDMTDDDVMSGYGNQAALGSLLQPTETPDAGEVYPEPGYMRDFEGESDPPPDEYIDLSRSHRSDDSSGRPPSSAGDEVMRQLKGS